MALERNVIVFQRRDYIALAGIVLMLPALALGEVVGVGVFIGSQLLAGSDVLLLVVGRFFPIATIWAIRAEQWLGPLPWKRRE